MALTALMALAIVARNGQSGLRLEGDALKLFKDRCRHVINVRTIRGVNATNGPDGQHKIQLDPDRGPLYKKPSFCFGAAALSMDARRLRGIPSPGEGVGIMDTVILLVLFLISGLLIVTPPVAVWRCLSQQAQGRAAWLYPALSLIGPFDGAFICLVLMWLPGYSGECGGWLGEVARCSGFSQYATETMFVAALGIAMPGILGMMLGVVVLVLGLIRR